MNNPFTNPMRPTQWLLCPLSLVLSWLLTGSVQAQQLAFPGAEGYGAYASGGRGCTVVHVTNLNAAGTGSLADAVSQSNRFVVFDVGGVIDITGISPAVGSSIQSVRYFTPQGIEMKHRPANGIYLERITKTNGSTDVKKVSVK